MTLRFKPRDHRRDKSLTFTLKQPKPTIMKAQLLCLVLLLSVLSAAVSAQDRSQSNIPVIPEHPLIKLFSNLEKGTGQQTVFKSVNDHYQLNSVEQQILDVDDSWVSYLKTEHIYEGGKRVESDGYVTLEPGGSWMMSSKELYTYENDLLTEIVLQGISEGEPVTGERTLISYQTSAGISLPYVTTYQYWDETEEEWISEDRTTFLVENGLIVGGSYDEWDIDGWIETERFTLEEINGDLVETILLYDELTEEWINYIQVIYSDLTVSGLYEKFNLILDEIDNGSLLSIFTLLPDFTEYEWVENGESGFWVATDRQVSTPSTELEFGATSSTIISTEFNAGEQEGWTPVFQVTIGFNDNQRSTGMSFYSITGENGSTELQKIFSEEYLYTNNDLLEFVMKYGIMDDFSIFKRSSMAEANGRTVLNWSNVNTSINPDEQLLSFRLNAAYPNPFNPLTVIPFQMATASKVTIQVFDMLGRNVAMLIDEFKSAGDHTVRFDGSGLSSGVYMIRFTTADVQQTRSVSLIK